jgi:hypothetical protein
LYNSHSRITGRRPPITSELRTRLGQLELAQIPMTNPGQPKLCGSLGPGAHFQSQIELETLTQDVVHKIYNGLTTFFIFGILTYEDAFGDKGRFLEYRLLTGGEGGVRPRLLYSDEEGNQTIKGILLYSADEGNRSDDPS